MRMDRYFFRCAVGLSLAIGTAGCSAGHGGSQAGTGETGTVSVALTGTAASGTPYHLANAVFEITNFATGLDTVISSDDPVLKVDLPPSIFPFDYNIALQDGWTLNAVNPDGSETPATATLLQNFISFTIKSQRTTPVVFPFQAGSEVVTMGNGTASVTIAVDDTLIDDFEDGDGLLPPISGRNGSWFVFNDGSGTQTPGPGDPIVPQVVDTSANFVFHMTGTDFAPMGVPLPDGTSSFGAGVGANLKYGPSGTVPYDASKYAGINFTFTTNSAPNLLLNVAFAIQTSATTPVENGGTCTAGCFDGFGFSGTVPPGQFSFTGGFTWDQLFQQGFGTPATFDPATIMSIQWVVGYINFGQPASADDFDFTLDDVAFQASFLSGSSSTGPRGGPGMQGGGSVDAGPRPLLEGGPVAGRRSWPSR